MLRIQSPVSVEALHMLRVRVRVRGRVRFRVPARSFFPPASSFYPTFNLQLQGGIVG